MSKSATRRRKTGRPAKGAAPKPAAAPPPRKPPVLLWLALAAVAVATVVGTVLLWPRPPGPGSVAQTGWPRVVTKVNSLYNDITVYEQESGLLTLAFGAKRLNYVELIVNPADELDLPVTYTQSMTAGLAYATQLNSAAIIGLGGGRTAWYYHKSVPGLDFTAAELDPDVVKIAARYFKVRPEKDFDIQVQDGRVWLTKSDKTFDVILIDAYRGPFVPFHLLTREFYKLVASHLNPAAWPCRTSSRRPCCSTVPWRRSAPPSTTWSSCAATAISSSSPTTGRRRTRQPFSSSPPNGRSNTACATTSPAFSTAASSRTGIPRPVR